MAADVAARLRQGFDEAEHRCLGTFSQIVRDCIPDIPAGPPARDARLRSPWPAS
jgi:hypothetical protein